MYCPMNLLHPAEEANETNGQEANATTSGPMKERGTTPGNS